MRVVLVYSAGGIFSTVVLGIHFWPEAPFFCMLAILLAASLISLTLGAVTEWFVRQW